MHTVHFDEDADIVDIRYDKAFKAVFTRDTPRTRQALSGLLSACIGRGLSVVSIAANEPPADSPRDRHIRYDIACRFERGELADVEMTLCPEPDEASREEYYAARLFISQDIRGSFADYRDLKSVYQINILANGIRYKDKDIVHSFSYHDPKHNLSFNGRTHIITVELEKAEETAREKPVEKMTPAESWAVFLRYHTEKKKRALVNEILQAKEDIAMAAENILEFTEKENEWFYNESRLKYELDRQSERVVAFKQGREEALIETAQKMKNAGLPLAQIREFTGLSAEEIDENKASREHGPSKET
ncbi:MAG: Rpn family recombination-promoting nuclease/putative transposase [Spirochaetales bacterium]|jgi:predicted transposase/invertase (TIGR01784 family)|nr:Rpn family recombination-promoting nuclease/putative transposase [Spirochaetales bacterium]